MAIKIQVLDNILQMNDSYAAENRRIFEENNSFAINMMSSPGSGKTTILERTLEGMDPSRVAIIEGDMRTTKDAERLERFGCQILQISTGNACHLDGKMIHDAAKELDLAGVIQIVSGHAPHQPSDGLLAARGPATQVGVHQVFDRQAQPASASRQIAPTIAIRFLPSPARHHRSSSRPTISSTPTPP